MNKLVERILEQREAAESRGDSQRVTRLNTRLQLLGYVEPEGE